MDLDRITNPLRLARGSHQPGSGKGCAMNVISYINGDEQITDFPATSARPLASFVQLCNDLLAGPDGYLSPENSLLVLDLGWLTVGTPDRAELPRRLVPGDMPPIAEWDSAARAARAVSETSEGAELYAVRAATQSTALVETDDWDTLDAVTGNALRAHRLANSEAGAARILEVTRNAIRSWRRLAGLSAVGNEPIPVAGVRPHKVVAA